MNAAAPLIRRVSAEEFIAGVAREADRDVAPRKLRNEECRNLRGIGERFVVQSWKTWDHRHRLFRCHVEFGVLGPDVLRDELRGFGFVEFTVVEADRKGFHRPLAVGLHDRDDQRRIDAARKERTERNIGFHAHGDRIVEQRIELIHGFFIGAAEWLIANHYTSSSKLAIEGTSNGGLLMGAMMTQRPDLFRAIVCGYPLLDMLRFQKFMKGSFWVPEYGSADDPVQFKYILKYSPYQNVKDGTAYPAVLFITGDGDTRVAPLHARKMAARLQSANNGPHPILLLYDTKSGHSGGRPLSKQIEEQTDALAFVFAQLGIAGAQ